jgi:ABC-type transport system involved in multi-copper enzyme maturation permease subunit
MTIFGSGYQALTYEPTSWLRRVWALAWLEMRGLFRTRWGTILFLVCQIPLIRSLFILTIWAGFWSFGGAAGPSLGRMSPEFSPDHPAFYLAPAMSESGFVFVLLLTTLVSARSIAKDRAARGLEILWTRGIGPGGYFFGKWLGSFALVGIGTVIGPLAMWCFAQSASPDEGFAAASMEWLPRTMLATLFFTAALTGLATALSSMARSPNLASILWVVVVVGASAVARVFSRIFRGESWVRALSPWDAAKRTAEEIAGVTPRIEFDASVAIGAVLLYGVLVCLLAQRRLRTEEAVG